MIYNEKGLYISSEKDKWNRDSNLFGILNWSRQSHEKSTKWGFLAWMYSAYILLNIDKDVQLPDPGTDKYKYYGVDLKLEWKNADTNTEVINIVCA